MVNELEEIRRRPAQQEQYVAPEGDKEAVKPKMINAFETPPKREMNIC